MTTTDTTDIALRPGNGLARFYDDSEQVELLKRTICRDATDDEFRMFLGICKRRGLDPFAKQIYFRLYKKPNGERQVTIITGIDAYRLIAERTGNYEGQTTPQWCGEDGKWVDIWLSSKFPVAARVGVWRSKFREPMWGVARWAEYFPTNDREQFMWKKMPSGQIAKCAEAIGLRKAFPEDLGNIYVQEEMDQAKGAIETEYEHPADVQARAEYREQMREDSRGAAASKPAPQPRAAPPPAPSPPGELRDSKPAGRLSKRDIMHDGVFLTPEQNRKIHAMREDLPGWNAKEEESISKWKQTLAPYPQLPIGTCAACKGSGNGKKAPNKCGTCYGRGKECPPVEHSNQLSYAQASHLIDLLQERLDKHAAAEAEIRRGGAAELLATVGPVDLLEKLHAVFTSGREEDEWLASLGYATADDVPEESRLTVCQLAAAWTPSDLTEAYRELVTKAYALGHVTKLPAKATP